MLPTFIIIGAMKSGTTSLHHYLGRHPEIVMAVGGRRSKTLDFFVQEKNYSKGRAWYEAHFSGQAKAYGEASGSYTKFPRFAGVPARMHAILPEAKLIYLMRDPVARTIAHYAHNYLEGEEQRSLEEVFRVLDTNHYVACSQYFKQLEQYAPYYSKEQILLITAEDFKAHRQATLRQVFGFLGVDASFYHPTYARLFHQTADKSRSRRLGRYLANFALLRAVEPYIPEQLARFSRRIVARPFQAPNVSEVLQRRLRDYLRTDVDALRAFTGCEFSQWRI